MTARAHTATSLTSRTRAALAAELARANRATAKRWPGDPQGRQPVHVVYGGAHLFRAGTAAKLGQLALAALNEYAPDGATLADAVGLSFEDATVADEVHARIVRKLQDEPVEDYRLDFEDGYGERTDAEEDGHAQSAARELAGGLEAGTLPPFVGLRIKALTPERYVRSLRTLDLFVTTLVRAAGRLPTRFVVTLPKILVPAHVRVAAQACAALERRLRLTRGSIGLELMIETPQAILGQDGRVAIGSLVDAGAGRVSSVHFGPYDYTALCGITAAWQGPQHPVSDIVRHLIQIALAQRGVRLADGPTTVMPVPPIKASAGKALSPAHRAANRIAVHGAWRRHFDTVTHALRSGIYQGWDLHPAQLVSRYAALYTFFLSSRGAATARLRRFVDQAAQATLSGTVFDDEASAWGLVNFFVRGLECGALTTAMVEETGLRARELRAKSFRAMLDGRTAGASARK